MNQETRGGLHKKLEEVLNLADVETIKFIIALFILTMVVVAQLIAWF